MLHCSESHDIIAYGMKSLLHSLDCNEERLSCDQNTAERKY